MNTMMLNAESSLNLSALLAEDVAAPELRSALSRCGWRIAKILKEAGVDPDPKF